ncbi:hypothetical protein [Cellulomonas sp. SLBN-39]|uniref:hypothetical protein n=1 Tax=Cellulomonas sp. SLBN-39 TaxID=2768446 RepID=UPI00114F6CDF|nr:hypothetical protein [Cellulomonas sp. SLBN-39]TQL01018.1 hypothetical protein FBY24_0060 [Cellulomonas sp. SLBN-39]
MSGPDGRVPWRVLTPSGKLAYLLLAPVAAVLGAVLLGVALGEWAFVPGAIVLQLVVVGVAVRTFRDADVEDVVAPRAPWRMTARPTSGFVLGGLFLVESVSAVLRAPGQPDLWAVLLAAAVSAALGVAFVRSSLRLRAGDHLDPR